MISPTQYRKLLTTSNQDLIAPLQSLLKEHSVDSIVRKDNMFWINFMGESRFDFTRKAKQNYTIFVLRRDLEKARQAIEEAKYPNLGK